MSGSFNIVGKFLELKDAEGNLINTVRQSEIISIRIFESDTFDVVLHYGNNIEEGVEFETKELAMEAYHWLISKLD